MNETQRTENELNNQNLETESFDKYFTVFKKAFFYAESELEDCYSYRLNQ